MAIDNQASFERCPHDRKNPYVMISREMLQDPCISPKAKGVLAYLLSLPSDWKIFHSQLEKGLNVGENYINSAMDELILHGYAERTRVKIKGVYQPYKYIIRELKKLVPNGVFQPGSSGPENQEQQSKEAKASIHTEETATAIAAASLEKKEEDMDKNKEIYACLKNVDVPENEKRWLTKKYSNEIIKNAIAWALHPETKINKSLIQALKWACVNFPETHKDPEEIIQDNIKFANQQLKQWMVLKTIQIETLSKHIEFVYLSSPKQPICISFTDKNFRKELISALEKTGCVHR